MIRQRIQPADHTLARQAGLIPADLLRLQTLIAEVLNKSGYVQPRISARLGFGVNNVKPAFLTPVEIVPRSCVPVLLWGEMAEWLKAAVC